MLFVSCTKLSGLLFGTFGINTNHYGLLGGKPFIYAARLNAYIPPYVPHRNYNISPTIRLLGTCLMCLSFYVGRYKLYNANDNFLHDDIVQIAPFPYLSAYSFVFRRKSVGPSLKVPKRNNILCYEDHHFFSLDGSNENN
ncbi:hypothetical protein LXL04_007200 [Taraxacum kok-saghyz]